MASNYSIEILKKINLKDLLNITSLLAQLDPTIPFPTKKTFTDIFQSPNIYLFVARNLNGEIVGTLTLTNYLILAEHKGWIEDVVVDKNHRGKGIAKNLMKNAFRKAKELKIKSLNLTSNPTRKEAHSLYQKLGFKIRNTNVYKYELGH